LEPPAAFSVARLEIVDESLVTRLFIDLEAFDVVEAHKILNTEDNPEWIDRLVVLHDTSVSLRVRIGSRRVVLR
jgi:hypothetical protein